MKLDQVALRSREVRPYNRGYKGTKYSKLLV